MGEVGFSIRFVGFEEGFGRKVGLEVRGDDVGVDEPPGCVEWEGDARLCAGQAGGYR